MNLKSTKVRENLRCSKTRRVKYMENLVQLVKEEVVKFKTLMQLRYAVFW